MKTVTSLQLSSVHNIELPIKHLSNETCVVKHVCVLLSRCQAFAEVVCVETWTVHHADLMTSINFTTSEGKGKQTPDVAPLIEPHLTSAQV